MPEELNSNTERAGRT